MTGLPLIACDHCQGDVDIVAGLERLAARGVAGQIARMPGTPALRLAVLRYVGLFAAKRLTPSRTERLLGEVIPWLEAGQITHEKRVWPAPLDYWLQAIDTLIALPTLRLPLKSHGLLLTILAGLSDRADAAQERGRHQRGSGSTPVGISSAHQPFPSKPEPKPVRNPAVAAQALADMKTTLKGS
jgi:hypothetical protein